MQKTSSVLKWIFLLLVFTGCAREEMQLIEIQTESGNIVVELYGDKAPVTVNNFLCYVESGAYRNSGFYRTVTMDNQPQNDIKIEVIQGGLYTEERMLAPIIHETTQQTGIRHLDGTISMARNEPGSATSEIFICIGDQPELDFGGRRNPDGQGFAAFGKVINGMETVRNIQVQPAEGQMLEPPVKIIDIVVIK